MTEFWTCSFSLLTRTHTPAHHVACASLSNTTWLRTTRPSTRAGTRSTVICVAKACTRRRTYCSTWDPNTQINWLTMYQQWQITNEWILILRFICTWNCTKDILSLSKYVEDAFMWNYVRYLDMKLFIVDENHASMIFYIFSGRTCACSHTKTTVDVSRCVNDFRWGQHIPTSVPNVANASPWNTTW